MVELLLLNTLSCPKLCGYLAVSPTYAFWHGWIGIFFAFLLDFRARLWGFVPITRVLVGLSSDVRQEGPDCFPIYPYQSGWFFHANNGK